MSFVQIHLEHVSDIFRTHLRVLRILDYRGRILHILDQAALLNVRMLCALMSVPIPRRPLTGIIDRTDQTAAAYPGWRIRLTNRIAKDCSASCVLGDYCSTACRETHQTK